MKSLDQILSNNVLGLYYGNRVLLPFAAHILKINIENDLITDFGPSSKGASINETEDYTEIYFLEFDDLQNIVSKYENIKVILVEKGKDIFDFKNHRKIALHPEEKHVLKISELDKETIFIE